MKHLKLIFACLLTAILSIGQMWAVDYDLVYTLDGSVTSTASGSSAYATAVDIVDNGITWNVMGNTSTNPWGIGGKNLSSTGRELFSKGAVSGNILKIEIEHGAASSVTVNSMKVEVATDADFTEIVSTCTPTFAASATVTVNHPDGDDAWENCYYRITYYLTIGGSNKKVEFKSAKFYKEKSADDPVLESITITGDLTNKSYEEGQSIDFAGLTATGNYDDESTADLTDAVEWSFTPALTVGLTSVTVTATLDEISGNKVISGLTVAEHVVTPGTYSITPNNVFFGTDANGSITGAAANLTYTGTQNDITVTYAKGSQSSMYINGSQCRTYSGSVMGFSVPAGYVIKAIAFTADGSNWAGTHTASAGSMTDNKNWNGAAQSFTITFGGTCRVKGISVTYAADVKYAINFSTPANGSLVINDGVQNITSGDEYNEGEELTVTVTPGEGYKLDGIKVIETGSDPENDVTSTVLSGTTLTVPAHAITVSATFVENVAPAVTSYVLSEIGVETSLLEDQHVGDVVTLPSTATECSKTFVGWSEDASCAVAPEYAPGAEYTLKANNKLYAVYADVVANSAAYVETAFASLASNDEVIVTEEKSSVVYALPNNEGTGSSPDATVVTVSENVIASADATLLWIISKDGANFSLTVKGGTNKLYCTNSNDGVRVGTNGNNVFHIENDATYGDYIYNNATSRFVGVNGTTDWRCYTSVNSNIKNGTLAFFKKTVSYENYSTTCAAALAKPTFNVDPADGPFSSAQSIVISAAEGTIRYTVDGTDPDEESPVYSSAIALDACGSTTIKAIAVDGERVSEIAEATFVIKFAISANTAETAYTPAQAKAIIDEDCDLTSEKVYVAGTVLTPNYFESSHTYNITLVGTEGFQFYKLKDLDNEVFSSDYIKAGDQLVAYGYLKKHNSTYELDADCYLISYTPAATAKTSIANDIDHPYTVAQADGYIDDPITYDLDDEVFVKGVVTATTSTKITIRDTKEGTEYIELYKSTLADGITAPVVGDLIIGKGTMQKYNSTTYQMNQGCQVVWKKPAATMTFDDMALVFGEVQSLVPTSITLAANTDIVFSIKEGSDDCITINEFNDVEAKSVEGTATVIATLSETEDYMGTSVEFNITVTAPDLRKIAIGSAFTAINGDLTPADINFAAYQGDGTNAPVLRASDNPVTIRLYKPATGKSTGGYLTITALPGCKIDQVQITFVGNADASYSIDDAEFSTTKYITGKTELLTPAGLDAQSVSIVNLKNGSIDISAIKVWYTGEPLPLPGISYSPSIQTIEVGSSTWSNPTLNNLKGVTIASYASDNEDVATVTGEGVISLKPGATGTAHITAHFAGNETYREEDAVYTIIVLSEIDALLTNSKWIRVDNAATLRAGMQVIVAQYGEGDVKAMGAQNSNNRAAVSATVSGNVLSPETGTQILTLVDAGEGKFAFLTTGGYLYAASSSSNYLKEEVEKDDKGNADWEISIAGGIATVIAQGTYTHNWMRYNSDNSLFSCYANGQADIALYVKADDYNRDVTAGRYGTICLPNGGVMEGATLYEVAYFDGAASKIFFDEIVNGTMEPGMPYIFLSNAPASKLGVIYSSEEPAVSAKNNNGLYGSFTQELLAKNDGNYIMLNNQYLFVNSDEVYVGANRAYIRLEDVPTTATPLAPGRRRISMGVANEQVATGIDNLNADEAPMKMMIDGQLFILRGEKLYDATGRLVK